MAMPTLVEQRRRNNLQNNNDIYNIVFCRGGS